ncbi:ferrous iron transport protein A [Candidatus Omnitrophota bacterium]
MILDLTKLKPGEKGRIAEIQGGHGIVCRLGNMGIRPGKSIIKVSAQFLRGPQTLKVDNLQVAIGFGMSRKILIEVQR